jgi:NAD-dependent deacetylase
MKPDRDTDRAGRVLTWLRDAVAQPGGVCVLTGAGMSAESGIPTFRDAMSGLWSQFDPAQLATQEGYLADPELVWDWYAERAAGVAAAHPNAGHHALADFERRHPGVLTLVTQNVDDLHQRAGNRDTIRLHGDILEQRWFESCPKRLGCALSRAVAGHPPRCPDCGNLVRPGVVWFGESLPPGALESAQAAASACHVLLVVGTSGAVWPAAGMAALARRSGAWVVIVNPKPSEIDDQAHLVLADTAANALPRLLAGA